MSHFDDAALKAKVEAVSRDLRASAADTAAVVGEMEDLHASCAALTSDAKVHIKDLSQRLAEQRRVSGTGRVEDEYTALAAELAELEMERDELVAGGASSAAASGDDEGVGGAAAAAADGEEDDDDEDPEVARTQHAVSLFTNITRVTWAPECGDGVVAGVVSHDDGHRARRFSIDTKGKDDFQVTAALWDLLDEDPAAAAY